MYQFSEVAKWPVAAVCRLAMWSILASQGRSLARTERRVEVVCWLATSPSSLARKPENWRRAASRPEL